MTVVFAGRMWRMGGFVERENKFYPINEIWSSADGRSWTLAAANPGWQARGGGTLVVFNEKLWLLGGTSQYRHKDDEALFNDVWSTENGVDWTNVSPHATWTPRAFHTALTHSGRLWVLGGGYWSGKPALYSDVWSTLDGIQWKQHTDRANWQGRIWATAVSYAGMLWIMGGFVGSPRGGANDVWYSRNGRSWLPYLASQPSWVPRLAQSAIVFDDKLWIVAGSNGEYYNDVWFLDVVAWSGDSVFNKILKSIFQPVESMRSFFS
ncbi:N-acetylneuraminic acid mutarotase [Nitrobacter vulgaris]|nr:N-acetylneuraminic acid mutarotase [Nitrobacter vulgaris]